MKNAVVGLVLVFGLVAFSGLAFPAEEVLFDFEDGTLSGWEIPDWVYEKDDYVTEEVDTSKDYASSGDKSMKLLANFPGDNWSGAIVEVMEYFDWTPYSAISCDIMVPASAPAGLKAKIVLTVGDSWKWTEMSRSVKLEPGQWVTIEASLKPGSTDWKRTTVTDEFRSDIRKIAIRVESNRRPAYSGPIYIDNIRLQ